MVEARGAKFVLSSKLFWRNISKHLYEIDLDQMIPNLELVCNFVILQYVQVSSYLTFHFLVIMNTRKLRCTYRQTDRHEYPIVAILETAFLTKIIVVVFSKLGYTLPYSKLKGSTLSEITSRMNIFLIYGYYPQ